LAILEATHIQKRYANHTALDDVSLTIPEKSIFGLLGPNGAGKTTLIRIINQIIEADSGVIKIKGEPLKPAHIEVIGYLPEERGLYKKMKVGDQLLYLAQLKGMPKRVAETKIKEWLRKFEIADWWGKKIEDLSKGMAQKVQFISTVLHDPELVILDEPFSGFDPINANLIKDEILELRERGKTIIFSTHRMESVEELCDHIALINKSKKILDGSKQDIKARFRTNTYVVEHKGGLTTLPVSFLLKSQEELGDGYFRSMIGMENGSSPNELLHSLLPLTEVHVFQEKIPTMNEIFIAQVGAENTPLTKEIILS
jgi:ABC-2 type transport system ATP-binding protein